MKEVYRYKITLTTRSPLHVGGVDEPLGGPDENPVAVIGGKPCIPGPTLKGAYRAQLERFLIERKRQSNSEDLKELTPCLTTTQPSPAEEDLAREGNYRKKSCRLGRTEKPETEEPQTPICPACYLLGAQGLVGFVSVPFLFAEPGVKIETLYSSRIDRGTGTVAKGANRSYQVIPPNSTFSGELELLVEDPFLKWKFGEKRPIKDQKGKPLDVDQWLDAPHNLPKEPQKLADILIKQQLEAIKLIGGYRSKGFGQVEIKVKQETEQ